MPFRTNALIIASAILLGSASVYAEDKAVEIAQSMMKAMGGLDAWNAAHFVRYDFKVVAGGKTVVSRSHLWDKPGGRYRLEQTNKAGEAQVVLFNTATKRGTAYVNDKRIDGDEAEAAVKDAYSTFINDMYWLSMPWKWMDKGVHLKYAGMEKGSDVVQLSFDKVGLTPGDQYKAYISPTSHLMTHWEYTLQGGNKGSWDWQYVDAGGGVKLAGNHVSEDGKSINMGAVRIMTTVADQYFTDPSRTLQTLK
ncbi:MAG: hypothetical protein ABJF23_06455 [Bryobacteraceae bacterium]